MQNSIDILAQTSESVTIGTNIEYAPYVEFGTRKMEAQPFLGPQGDRMFTRAPAILSEEITGRM